MAGFEPFVEDDFSVSEPLFDVDVDVDLTPWFQFYEQSFPPVVRFYLHDIMENWVKLEFYARDDPAFAERVLTELQSKADKLPISDVTQVSREEITKFVKTHSDNPSRFLEMINEYCQKESMDSSDSMQSNLVVTLSKASYELKKKLISIKQCIVTELSTSFSEELTREILAYYEDLKKVVTNTADIKDYVQQTLEKLRNYQAQESECEKFYVKEMADIWEKLLHTIDSLLWQIQEISNVCQFNQPIDTSCLETAMKELVASSMIIVESPRLNERTLRVKKKKVTYALQIILPADQLEGPANVNPYLLSEEGFTRLRRLTSSVEPDSADVGTSSLYSTEQPVIKDPNSNQYRCVFSELGFDNMSRERKRARSGSVMTIKLVYMFRALLTYRGRKIWARCFSMPVVTSSHNDQAVQGTATLVWDAYFPLEMREGLETRTNVSWSEIGFALKNLILRQTGRRITSLNLRFLRSVFLGRRRDEADFDEDEKRFQMSDLLRPIDGGGERGLTFWDWLWGTLTMLTAKESKFLLNLWRNGYVIGYISQEKAHEVISNLLKVEKKHYFLLRFSKRDGKAIVLQGYIEGPDSSKEPEGVFSVLPYKLEHLRETPLQQRIMKRRDCGLIVFENVSDSFSYESKEKVFEPDEQVRRLTKLPSGYVDREMSECTPRVPKDEAVETEMVVEELDVTSRLF